MQNLVATLIGKIIRLGLIFRPSGGHALPGLIIEKIFPNYVASMLKKIPDGVIVITGTNGKTTTTKIVTHILRANHKKVLTNTTGSNLIRGIASALSRNATLSNRLPYDIAVLEVDEATARKLVEQVRPRWVLALNVSRDQLDRFGEVDTIASYVQAAMEKATEGIVTNSEDPKLLHIGKETSSANKIKSIYFGFSDELRRFFPTDYELAAVGKKVKVSERSKKSEVDVELVNFSGQDVTYKINGQDFKVRLRLTGQHNYLNGAAALALCRALLPEAETHELISALSDVSLAFGRGERYKLKNGAVIELVLVKNPASFTQALLSYVNYLNKNPSLMIAINDNIADGRDVSWLWDVNFEPLYGHKVALTSGHRAADMALNLSYQSVDVETIEPDLLKALRHLSKKPGDKVIFATYTSMLTLYDYLSKNGTKLK
jgi:UDP-N-acetylmuramyl tripeptide synthase